MNKTRQQLEDELIAAYVDADSVHRQTLFRKAVVLMPTETLTEVLPPQETPQPEPPQVTQDELRAWILVDEKRVTALRERLCGDMTEALDGEHYWTLWNGCKGFEVMTVDELMDECEMHVQDDDYSNLRDQIEEDLKEAK